MLLYAYVNVTRRYLYMEDKKELYAVFKHFSYAVGVGVRLTSVSGENRYSSPILCELTEAVNRLLTLLDCAAEERMALLYGCYQARRFGGRYIFLGPSGLAYCASPLLDERGALTAGAIAGPYLMTDHDDYLTIDVCGRLKTAPEEIEYLKVDIAKLPYYPPQVARAVSEQLLLCATHALNSPKASHPIQIDALAYPLDKEDELLDAVNRGDVQGASAMLNDILSQVLFNSGSNFEVLRSRVFELTVLLSQATLKGGANIDAILGINYAYLREIDSLSTVEDLVGWLHGVTRRFGKHVFDFSGAKNMATIYRAVAYINANYMHRITLQDMADHVYLSPSYFSKMFKDETGQTPIGFLNSVRIDASKKLLREQSLNLADIPEATGFDNQSYFTRVFKKVEGVTPSRYRKKNR